MLFRKERSRVNINEKKGKIDKNLLPEITRYIRDRGEKYCIYNSTIYWYKLINFPQVIQINFFFFKPIFVIIFSFLQN